MRQIDGEAFPVGYKKPPRQTQFKPGCSGNPKGRPKRTGKTFAESLERELSAKITGSSGANRFSITAQQAIAKRLTQKAISGDHKATQLIMSTIEAREYGRKDNLSPLLEAMRSLHAKHEMPQENDDRPMECIGVDKDELAAKVNAK